MAEIAQAHNKNEEIFLLWQEFPGQTREKRPDHINLFYTIF